MKVTYLKLTNFANIFTATNKKSIEIDFTKCKNNIVLFVGKNGSGKTSILSELHPFATAGSMDTRNDTCLIMEGTDGYKEIHIEDNGDIYIIKHHYNFSHGKTMKSYISKNNIELNPNGNVTSFKELVKLHLGLEQELLRLMRLGSNVSSLIDMKASSRKSFATDLFQDIDIYSSFHKRVSEEYRVLRSLIKSVVSKIEKLRIVDKSEVDNIVDNLNKRLQTFNNDREVIIETNAVLKSNLNQFNEMYKLDELPEMKSVLNTMNVRLKGIHKEINKLIERIPCTVSLCSEEDVVEELRDEVNELKVKIQVTKANIESSFKVLDLLYKQKEQTDSIIKSFISDERKKEITDMLDVLLLENDNYKNRFNDFNPTYTKEDLMFLLSHLQNLDNIVNDLNQFSDKAKQEVLDIFQKGLRVESHVHEHLKNLTREKNNLNIELAKVMDTNFGSNALIIYQPAECLASQCPYIDFYESSRKKNTGNIETLKGSIRVVDNKIEYYESYLDIQDVFYNIRKYIQMNEKYFNVLPELDLSFKTVLGKILSGKPYYNEDYITDLITNLEDYNKFKELQIQIQDIEKELEEASKVDNKIDDLNKELRKISQNIFDEEVKQKTLKENIDSIEEELSEKELLLSTTINLNELYNEKTNLIKEYNVIAKDYKFRECKLNELSDIERRLTNNDRELNNINHQIQATNNELKDYMFRIQEFESLTGERKYLEEKFDDIAVLKEALSSNKGIPLLYLQLYLKNCTICMNQLLDIIYNGTLEVCDFEINDKEFKIPYVKNGMKISDVIYSSQGERSFISLVLSLALIIQTVEKYNIMLLDEVDATLDTKNRQVFINLLEKLIEKTGAEQIFMISHNNMFDNYPVDVIMTSDTDIDNLKNVNIIYKG